MRIGIDARFLGTETGIGRYVEELIKNLEQIAEPRRQNISPNHAENSEEHNRFFIFLTDKNWEKYEPKSSNFHKVKADFRWYSWQEQVFFPFLIKKHKIDLMHFPHFNVPLFCRVPFVVTIHDLILLHYPSTRATRLGFVKFYLKYFFYRLILKNAVVNSKAILVPSEFTKKDILENFSLPHLTSPSRREGEVGGGGNILASKIIVTYEASSLNEVAPAGKEFLDGLKIDKPYFLTVGNAYPHKNLERLFRVFKKLNEFQGRRFQLVFVGPDDYFYKRVKNYARELVLGSNEVIMPGKVSDAELKLLYLNAFAHVFPSLYEGFGLPGIEAMSCGAPVISSNKTSLPEIFGDAALYFNPEDEGEMLGTLERLVGDKGLEERMRQKGFGKAKQYNWQDLAIQTIKIYGGGKE